MSKKDRQLTPAEQKRKADFEIICEAMEKKGYSKKDLTVSVLKANIMAFIIMLPFMAVFAWLYYTVNSTGEIVISLKLSILLLPILICLIVLHELIHGITWGIFAEKHFHSIEFGVIWSALTPYCTCSEPMKRWQYILGGAMPTLVLGGGVGVVPVVTRQLIQLLLSELMILSGGGDFLIILKILLYRSGKKETVYYDHPYECGVVVFEK